MILKKALFFTVGWLYRLTFQSIFNITANAFWLTRMHLGDRDKLDDARKRLAYLRNFSLDCYAHALQIVGARYMYDGITKKGLLKKWPTWTALPIVLAYRGFAGNCQDFAVLAKYCFPGKVKIKIMVPLSISRLADGIHYVGYWADKDVIFSNTHVLRRGIIDDGSFVWLQ